MSVEKLLAERATTHGDYTQTAVAQQAIKAAIRSGPNWDSLPDIVKESLEMIAHKLGRIVAGNPYVIDHYRDIVGYSTLVIDRVEDGVGLKQPAAPVPPGELQRALVGKKLDLMQNRMTEERMGYGGNPGFQVGAIEPIGPGTPEDGGHHARQADEPERVIMSLGPEDVGKMFRTRGGDLVQIDTFSDHANFPVLLSGKHGRTLRERLRTRRGRVHWQIEPHADDPGDLVEWVEAVAG